MDIILVKTLQLILSLSILVLVHEFGHFLFARLFKVRVEKFYLFFNPWFTLYKFKPKGSSTEWGLGWLPLGGYCKIAGMVDESMDKEQMQEAAKPDEYRSKPVWQRFLIVVGGVLFNFLLALFIYGMVLFTWGEGYLLPKDLEMGMEYGVVAQEMGFENGDVLLTADGQELDEWPNAVRQIANAREVQVLRSGAPAVVYMGDDLMKKLLAEKEPFAAPIYPYIIDSVIPTTPLHQAGMQRGDSIVSVNGLTVTSFNQYSKYIAGLQKKGGSRKVKLTYARGGEMYTAIATLDENYKGGAYPYQITHYFPPRTAEYGFFAAIPAGANLGVKTMQSYVSDLKYVFTKEGANSLGGFGTIGSIFPETWNWYSFWMTTAFLSIILAVMNILPIPALDGGHVVFLIYEWIFRRKPSVKFMERTQTIGMFLLLALMLWANFNDVLRYVF